MAHLFDRADALNYEGMVYKQQKDEMNYDHSRIEYREYTIIPSMYLPQYQSSWSDLSAFVRVKTIRHVNDKVEEATRYYITSIPFKKYKKMPEAIREHWGVENRLHYKLDVGMHEDRCPIYRGHAAENLCIMRKMVLQLLERENSCKEGIAMKRLNAALSTRYLRKVVGF